VNILLIQLKRIGDLILTAPAIAALRAQKPDAKITLVLSRETAALLPALPGVDRALIIRRSIADIRTLSSIAFNRFDYAIDFTRNSRSAFLSFLSHAQKRIVSFRVKKRAPFRGRAYNEFVHHRMRDMHTIDYNLSLLEPLGVPPEVAPSLSLTLPEPATREAASLLEHAGVRSPFVVMHPGSARVEKFWEPKRWGEVIRYIVNEQHLDVAITGGTSPLEQSHLAEIMAELPRPEENPAVGRVIDLSGKMDLLTLAAVIARARMVLTVDSAPVHLAAALKIPQVALYGPTNPFHWRPRDSVALILQGDGSTPMREFVPKQPRLPMKLISTQAVIDAMNALLSTPDIETLRHHSPSRASKTARDPTERD
jgi:predicted lipopolysaccharide heptosyltransferase III